MVRTLENGFSIPPFLLKCYEMVDDESTNALISWSSTNDSFIIWDMPKFSSELLPKYFKHGNFSSFVRQLNIYGFRKTDTDRWEFANEEFVKGQQHLLKNIIRRKHSPAIVQHRSLQQKDLGTRVCEENKNIDLWKEVEILKTDKNALMQEFVKLRQHQKTSHTKLLLLREQLEGMEKNQQQMLSFIVMAMQNPGLFVKFLQPKENNWLMAEAGKNILKQVMDDCEPVPSERMLVRYQPPTVDSSEPRDKPTSNPEDSLTLDIYPDDMKDLFMNIDFTLSPLDQKLLSTEFPDPFVIPDLPNGDDMLEQLLLTSPLLENTENVDLTKDPDDNGMEMDPPSCEMQFEDLEFAHLNFIADGSEKSLKMQKKTTLAKNQQDNSQNVDVLTEQMGHLASESSPNINFLKN